MRQLLPEPLADVDPYDAYRLDPPATALLRVNFVSTVDGRVTDVHGRSAQLGGPGDRDAFQAMRALADAIVVGAGTVRVERYGPHRPPPELAERRLADGRDAPAPIVVVSRSLELDLDAPLFTQAQSSTIVVTCAAAPPDRLRRVQAVADAVVVGDALVDLPAALHVLRDEYRLAHLLCEGGPHLTGELLAADLVDELCLTLVPQLAGDPGPRLVRLLAHRLRLELVSVLESQGELLTRYRVLGPL